MLVKLIISAVLAGATFVHAGNGWLFSNANGGWEFPLFWTMALIVQAMLGNGAYALQDVVSASGSLRKVAA